MKLLVFERVYTAVVYAPANRGISRRNERGNIGSRLELISAKGVVQAYK